MEKESKPLGDKSTPWIPISNSVDIKYLGKLAEELNEAGSAVARCLIQGIDECEPITQKSNRIWLEEEIADVEANIELVKTRFQLNSQRISARRRKKKALLSSWHNALDKETVKLVDANRPRTNHSSYSSRIQLEIFSLYGTIVFFLGMIITLSFMVIHK